MRFYLYIDFIVSCVSKFCGALSSLHAAWLFFPRPLAAGFVYFIFIFLLLYLLSKIICGLLTKIRGKECMYLYMKIVFLTDRQLKVNGMMSSQKD